MSEGRVFTEVEAHRHFAIQYNGKTWGLLEKPDRNQDDDDLMVYAAHTSLAHWREAGTSLHHQRGEWLIARVYAVLGIPEAALYHANRCLALTEEYADLMEDFDRAYAYEGVARANAIAGNREDALKYIDLAVRAGEAIADEQSKETFSGDLDGGEWAGLK
jgi:tetratricopeptide (TPR) repeat protein